MIPSVEPMVIQRAKRGRGTKVGEESHKWHEFVYYLSCEGRLTLCGKEYEMRPGWFVTIPPNALHSEFHTVDGIVFFCIFDSDADFEPKIFDDDPDATIGRLCESISAESSRPTGKSRELQTLLMQEILVRVSCWDERKSGIRHDLERAAEVIRMNFREPLRISELAADIGYGYDFFQHAFKEAFGRSPKQLQLDCRISAAKKLLRAREYNCTEIAYLCGFSDSAQFSSLFKREVGMTPKDFRKDQLL